MKAIKNIRLFLFLTLVLFCQKVTAQKFDTVPITLNNPYNTVLVHLHYLQEETYEPNLSARTLYGVEDSTQASKLAIRLKQILDGKGLYVQVRTIPRDSLYRPDSLSNDNYYILFPDQLPEVYLERVDGKWYYSEETVDAINDLHKTVYPLGADLLLNLLPKVGQTEVLGLKLWQYLGLIIILLITILLFVIFSRILNPIVTKLSQSKRYSSIVEPKITRRITRYISILIILRVVRILLPSLQLPPESSQFAIIVIKLVTLLLIVLITLDILTIFINYGQRYTETTESKLDEQLVPILKRTMQTIIISLGIIQGLRIMEVDVTALIAGISIGGLAIALAAQDMLKNLFGSLTIFMDRPFQIGDWINFSGVDGTVEEVGFRSTRVRTFANSLVYVPNGKLADMVVNNYGLRKYRRFNTTISITYDTPPALIDNFVKGLREIVLAHPSTRKDYFEIHLNGMGAHSLDILFYTFFIVPSWSDELKTKHEILLAILELGEELGVRFAYPTSTLFVEEVPGAGSLTPKHNEGSTEIDQKLENFIKKMKNKYT